MKIESALRQINKRIAEYKDYFGNYSYEYGYAKNLIVTALKNYTDPEAMAKYTQNNFNQKDILFQHQAKKCKKVFH